MPLDGNDADKFGGLGRLPDLAYVMAILAVPKDGVRPRCGALATESIELLKVHQPSKRLQLS